MLGKIYGTARAMVAAGPVAALKKDTVAGENQATSADFVALLILGSGLGVFR